MREVQVPKEDFMVGLDYMHKGALREIDCVLSLLSL